MASSSEASCISDPNFAVICAFLERFAKPCGITYPSFVDLQEMLENSEQVPQELIDLHIKLLRKARKTVFIEKWERALIKFCHTYSTQDGWEIERFGYKKSRLEVKLRVLKMLLEGQFDLNNKFKTSINTLEAQELRSKPIGKDKLGRIYWLQFDPLSNIRVYREDLDEESWTLVAKDRTTLVELLQELSGDEFPLDLNLLNEDSTSLEVDKPVLDTGQNSNSSFKHEGVSMEQNSNNVAEKQDPLETNKTEKPEENSVNEECKSETTNSKESTKVADSLSNAAEGKGEEMVKQNVANEVKGKEAVKQSEPVEGKSEEGIKKGIPAEGNSDAGVKQKVPIEGKGDKAVKQSVPGQGEEAVKQNIPVEDKSKEAENKPVEETKPTVNEEESKKEDVIVGEAIEEPVMYVVGEGCGEDCETGNPEKEEKSQEECDTVPSEKNLQVEPVEGSSRNSTELDASTTVNTEKLKPAPKLWSIDTICGVNSSKENSADTNLDKQESKDVKIKQKNFSSFSIDSVLEKKDTSSSLSDSHFSKFSVGCSDKFIAGNLDSKGTDNLNEPNISFPKMVNSEQVQSVIETPKVLLCSVNSKTENLVDKVESNININKSVFSENILPEKEVDLCKKVSDKIDCSDDQQKIENKDILNEKGDVISPEVKDGGSGKADEKEDIAVTKKGASDDLNRKSTMITESKDVAEETKNSDAVVSHVEQGISELKENLQSSEQENAEKLPRSVISQESQHIVIESKEVPKIVSESVKDKVDLKGESSDSNNFESEKSSECTVQVEKIKVKETKPPTEKDSRTSGNSKSISESIQKLKDKIVEMEKHQNEVKPKENEKSYTALNTGNQGQGEDDNIKTLQVNKAKGAQEKIESVEKNETEVHTKKVETIETPKEVDETVRKIEKPEERLQEPRKEDKNESKTVEASKLSKEENKTMDSNKSLEEENQTTIKSKPLEKEKAVKSYETLGKEDDSAKILSLEKEKDKIENLKKSSSSDKDEKSSKQSTGVTEQKEVKDKGTVSSFLTEKSQTKVEKKANEKALSKKEETVAIEPPLSEKEEKPIEKPYVKNQESTVEEKVAETFASKEKKTKVEEKVTEKPASKKIEKTIEKLHMKNQESKVEEKTAEKFASKEEEPKVEEKGAEKRTSTKTEKTIEKVLPTSQESKEEEKAAEKKSKEESKTEEKPIEEPLKKERTIERPLRKEEDKAAENLVRKDEEPKVEEKAIEKPLSTKKEKTKNEESKVGEKAEKKSKVQVSEEEESKVAEKTVEKPLSGKKERTVERPLRKKENKTAGKIEESKAEEKEIENSVSEEEGKDAEEKPIEEPLEQKNETEIETEKTVEKVLEKKEDKAEEKPVGEKEETKVGERTTKRSLKHKEKDKEQDEKTGKKPPGRKEEIEVEEKVTEKPASKKEEKPIRKALRKKNESKIEEDKTIEKQLKEKEETTAEEEKIVEEQSKLSEESKTVEEKPVERSIRTKKGIKAGDKTVEKSLTTKEETKVEEEAVEKPLTRKQKNKKKNKINESSTDIADKTENEESLLADKEDTEVENPIPPADKEQSEVDNEESSSQEKEEAEVGKVKKRRRRRKKVILPQRILSRNRKTTESETKVELPKQTKTRRKSGENKKKTNEDTKMEVDEVETEKNEEEPETKEDEEKEPSTKTEETTRETVEAKEAKRRRGRRRKNRRGRHWAAVKEPENDGDADKKLKEDKDEGKSKEDETEDKSKEKDEAASKKKGRPKKEEGTPGSNRPVQCREIKLLGITEADLDVPSVRQSRRIAQIKMKEEAERRRMEALQLESFKTKKSKGKKRSKKNAGSDSYDEKNDNDDDSDDERMKTPKEGKRSRKKKKKDKLVFDELNPWLSSSGSSTAVEEEEDIDDDPHEDDELVFKSDHEFSPESDVEDPDYKPIKRARTAKVEESKDEAGKYDDTSCEKCGNNDHPEWILLCDKCDKGWHASCVRPALMVVPEGDWFCPPCEHLSLITKLQESLAQYDRCQKQRENEELRKKRLAFVGISLDNVLPASKKKSSKHEDEEAGEEKGESESESGSASESESESESDSGDSSEPVYQLRERRSNVTSYRYNEYDELIKSALQDEIEAVKGAGNAGRGKDINNIVIAQKQEEEEEKKGQNAEGENGDKGTAGVDSKELTGEGQNDKPKEKVKKGEDDDYNVDTEEDEEDENVVDEIPPVVPKYSSKKKKTKSVKITSLDFTSEEEDNNSDSDFKGTSSEEESDYSLPSESESSDGNRRRKRGSDGPLRRSTRARVSRYDRDFINDDSDDDSPKRKKNRRMWDSSESSDSDRSWGRRKRKSNKSSGRKRIPKSKPTKKKKQKKRIVDSGSEEYSTPRKSKNKKIRYGGLDSPDEDKVLERRTRGKKINYQEMNGSDSEDDTAIRKIKSSRVIESDDDFVAENEKEDVQDGESEEMESGVDEDEEDAEENPDKEKKPIEKKKKILEKIKKKKSVIPDPDDFSENDLMEDEQLDEVVEELEDLDEEEEEILGNILESGDVPIHELKSAVKRAKEERKLKKEAEMKGKAAQEKPYTELPKPFPPIPAHLDFPGGGKFPKIGRVKITPSRAELASQMAGLTPQSVLAMSGKTISFLQGSAGHLPPKSVEPDPNQPKEKGLEPGPPPGGFLLNTLQGDPKLRSINDANIPLKHSIKDDAIGPQRPFMPYSMDTPPGGPLNMMAMMNSQQQSDGNSSVNNGRPMFNSFQGIGSPPARMPLYPPTIPTTVTGISNMEAKKKPMPKSVKRKLEEQGSPSEAPESAPIQMPPEDFMQMKGVQDSPPKKKGRGRGKKQLLAEAQAQGKSEVMVATVQPPTQFPSQGLPSEGGSVITRMLNNPQNFAGGDSNNFPAGRGARPPFRPSIPPNFSSPPGNIPGMRMRVPVPGSPMFHTSHPLDPSPSGGGAINIPVTTSGLTKPSPPSSTQIIPRLPPDPNVKHPFPPQNSPPRPEFSSFPNYYGNFPPGGAPIPGNDDPNFQNPPFPEQFPEGQAPSGGNPKSFEEEGSGEFGGLASYFASQREDDLDT